jgi:hypothetical protein
MVSGGGGPNKGANWARTLSCGVLNWVPQTNKVKFNVCDDFGFVARRRRQPLRRCA